MADTDINFKVRRFRAKIPDDTEFVDIEQPKCEVTPDEPKCEVTPNEPKCEVTPDEPKCEVTPNEPKCEVAPNEPKPKPRTKLCQPRGDIALPEKYFKVIHEFGGHRYESCGLMLRYIK